MPDSSSPAELKKLLLARGFEIYRSTGEEVVLAERVRENLLMDSGVAVKTGAGLRVRLVVRAEAGSFPGAATDELWERARRAADPARQRGYLEISTKVVPIADPGDRSRTLDTWYEVWLERAAHDVEELVTELTHALALEKTAG